MARCDCACPGRRCDPSLRARRGYAPSGADAKVLSLTLTLALALALALTLTLTLTLTLPLPLPLTLTLTLNRSTPAARCVGWPRWIRRARAACSQARGGRPPAAGLRATPTLRLARRRPRLPAAIADRRRQHSAHRQHSARRRQHEPCLLCRRLGRARRCHGRAAITGRPALPAAGARAGASTRRLLLLLPEAHVAAPRQRARAATALVTAGRQPFQPAR